MMPALVLFEEFYQEVPSFSLDTTGHSDYIAGLIR
jgi:hypothetical protein